MITKKENTEDNNLETNENLQESTAIVVGSKEEVVSEKPKTRTRATRTSTVKATPTRTRTKVVKEATVTEAKAEEVLEETVSVNSENTEIMKD